MKRRLLVLAALAATLSLSLPNTASARPNECYEETLSEYTCATTCVWYNDQGSVEGYDTSYHAC